MKGVLKKKSLEQALSSALLESQEHRDVTYYVLDKPGRRAVCHASELRVWNRISEGYSVAYKVRNGLLIK